MKLPYPIERPNASTPGVMSDAVDVTQNGETVTLANAMSLMCYTQSQWEAVTNKETILSQFTKVLITEN